MANPNGSVADPVYPGTVLEPNDSDAFGQPPVGDNLSQFGSPLERPQGQPAGVQSGDAAPKGNADPKEAQRFEFWQSKATKAEQQAAQLAERLKAVEPFLPLMSAIERDRELQGIITNRLSGAKPLEAPQKPANYSEAEAYSNPQSESFQYRLKLDQYRDEKINQLERQTQAQMDRQQADIARQRQANAERQRMLEFQQAVVEMGVPPQEFPNFMNLVNNATKEEMVEFWQWKQERAGVVGATRSLSHPGSGFPAAVPQSQAYRGPVDIGESLLRETNELIRRR